MSGVFEKILTQGIRSGKIPAREQAARDWYRSTAGGETRVRTEALFKDKQRLTSSPQIGSMYMYKYDAKHKATLPYWDQMPLVIPFDETSRHFSGLNFHYLPPLLRAKLLDALYDIANNDRFDETTKLKITYDTLKSAARFKYFKPTVKTYLKSQVKSRFLYIYPVEWDIAIFLPTARFTGARQETVWKDSKNNI